MPTPAEILTLINNEITTNGNNEITAEVMRPVLAAMVNQINDLVGDEVDLPDGYTDVISALNGLVLNLANGFAEFDDDYVFGDDISVARHRGTDSTVTAFLPDASTNTNREITIINASTTVSINTDVDYVDIDDNDQNTVALSTFIKLKSSGARWYRIG